VLAQRDLDLHPGIGVVAQNLDHLRQRFAVRRRLLDHFGDDDLPGPRGAAHVGRDQDVLADALVFRDQVPDAALLVDAADDFAIGLCSSTSTRIAPSGRPRRRRPSARSPDRRAESCASPPTGTDRAAIVGNEIRSRRVALHCSLPGRAWRRRTGWPFPIWSSGAGRRASIAARRPVNASRSASPSTPSSSASGSAGIGTPCSRKVCSICSRSGITTSPRERRERRPDVRSSDEPTGEVVRVGIAVARSRGAVLPLVAVFDPPRVAAVLRCFFDKKVTLS
jgi:hypothetical protein